MAAPVRVVADKTTATKAVFRLSGTAGLEPVESGETTDHLLTGKVLNALMKIGGVCDAYIVKPSSPQERRNIVVCWSEGCDGDQVGRLVWAALRKLLKGSTLGRGFWQ